MEIQCPRCESTFAVDPQELHLHQGVVCCGICQQLFQVPLGAHGAEAVRERKDGSHTGRYLLPAIILVLMLALLLQVLWWTRSYAYLATSTPIRQFMVRMASAMGTRVPWPGPNWKIRIIQSTISVRPGNLAVIRGRIQNASGMVQAFPRLQVKLVNPYGSTIAHLVFRPEQYLPEDIQASGGFAPGARVSFTLQSPQLSAVPGYQVTVLGSNPDKE